ncbi:MAG: RsiV family protein [Bryobacteraceae bacterium]
MMLRLIALIVSTSCLSVAQGPLGFELKRVERKTPGCVITFEYPEIVSAASALARDRINAGILQILLRPPQWPPAPDSGIRLLEGYVNFFQKQCQGSHDWAKGTDEGGPVGRALYEHKRVTIFRYTPPILSLRCVAETDAGGVHPYGTTVFLNFEMATGKNVRLSDMLKSGGLAKLESVAEVNFRRDHNLPASEDLSATGFSFPGDRFKLNDNFGVGEDELVFVFNTYEISAGAMGATEIRLPYQVISELLKPEMRLSQW